LELGIALAERVKSTYLFVFISTAISSTRETPLPPGTHIELSLPSMRQQERDDQEKKQAFSL